MKITVLMNDYGQGNTNLMVEHGLSFWVEHNGVNVLMDAGCSDKVIFNAGALGVDLSAAHYALCSHAHFDHGDGFQAVAKTVGLPNLVTGPGFFIPKYRLTNTGYVYKSLVFDENWLVTRNIPQLVCNGILEIGRGLYALGDFPPPGSLDPCDNGLYILKNGNYEPDTFSDEICLVAETEKGLVLIVGCSHPGIVNMSKSVMERLGRPLYAVIGGAHLLDSDMDCIDGVLAALLDMGVQKLGLLHCTGEKAIARLQEKYPDNYMSLAAGSCIEF